MKQQSDSSAEDIAEISSAPSTQKQKLTNDTQVKKKSKKKKNHKNLIANLIDTQYSVVRKVVKGMLGMKVIKQSEVEDYDLYWTDNAVTSEQLGKLKPYQKINHFPGMYTLSRKNYLARNLIKMQKQFPNDYNFFPKTWVLPSQLNQLRNFMQKQPNTVVIAKPQASSQGKGIFLTKSFQNFEFGQHYVVQKYLKKPFLIDGLKFDLRVYVLVAGCQPLRIYIYKQGLARFATQTYCAPKKQNLNNLYMHLTNYAINKNNAKFQFNSSATEMNKGHKRSLTSILYKLQQMGHDKQKVWDKIKECIAKTMISAQPILAHQYKSSQPNNLANNMCFEILGFDVILDHNLKPEILQVNYTPSFTTDTPLDLEIKKNLIHDSLVIMNLTSKAKSQIINEKKKQMKQRTLTGKTFYNSRQSRVALTNKIHKLRNAWQNQHLGNFQRVYPVFIDLPTKGEKQNKLKEVDFQDEQDPNQKLYINKIQNKQNNLTLQSEKQKDKNSYFKTLQQKYKQFLQYSVNCYESNTGANVRRNNKLIAQSKSASQGLAMINQEEPQYYQQKGESAFSVHTLDNISKGIYNQTTKYTNTQNLQKIYKSKFRPMLYKKSKFPQKQLKSKQKDEQNQRKLQIKTPLLSKIPSEIKEEPEKQKIKCSPYTSINKMQLKNKNPNVEVHNLQRNHTTMKQINITKKQDKIHPMKNRVNSSLRKGLSTVYNITFNDRNKLT